MVSLQRGCWPMRVWSTLVVLVLPISCTVNEPLASVAPETKGSLALRMMASLEMENPPSLPLLSGSPAQSIATHHSLPHW